MLEETLLGYALEGLHTKKDSCQPTQTKRAAGVILLNSRSSATQSTPLSLFLRERSETPAFPSSLTVLSHPSLTSWNSVGLSSPPRTWSGPTRRSARGFWCGITNSNFHPACQGYGSHLAEEATPLAEVKTSANGKRKPVRRWTGRVVCPNLCLGPNRTELHC
jgi:hypothetical protein